MSWHRDLHWHERVLKLCSVPEDEILCTRSIDSLQRVTSKGCVASDCVCVEILGTFQRFYTHSTPRHAAAAFLCFVIFQQWSCPLCIYDTPEWRSFPGRTPGTQKVGEIRKHDELLCSTAPLCPVLSCNHIKTKLFPVFTPHAAHLWM